MRPAPTPGIELRSGKLMFGRIPVVAFLVATAACSSAYVDAQVQASKDRKDPQYREWLEKDFQPAFNQVFPMLMVGCAHATTPSKMGNLGFVVTIGSSGAVKRILWKRETDLTSCLEPGFRKTTFPRSPTEEFYFGMESRERR